jgi:hypothetical protein
VWLWTLSSGPPNGETGGSGVNSCRQALLPESFADSRPSCTGDQRGRQSVAPESGGGIEAGSEVWLAVSLPAVPYAGKRIPYLKA